jgi:flagellar basal-body rod protein FlgF
MPYGVYLSAAGAHAQSHRMQVLSHNLANVDTPGFKPQQTILQARFAELIEEDEVPSGLGGADDIGGGVTIQKSLTEFNMGARKQTGRLTDFAIDDESSFFVVNRDNEQLLTRAGNFLFDSTGKLVNQKGDMVLSSTGGPIQLDPSKPYTVAAGGVFRQGNTTAQLMLAKPRNLGDLSHTDENHFKPLAPFDILPNNERRVQNSSLEHSAVSPTAAMMELVETSRVYEANVRMIQNQDSAMGSLISKLLA